MSDLLEDIAANLQRDYAFKVAQGGKYLQKGVCPSCGKKEMWTYAASPWVIRCQRTNQCGYEAHAKDLYPDLFESWTERFQEPEKAKSPEQQNPRAAAEAYLRINRGFDLARIAGLFTQESYYDPRADQGRGAGSSTVRFALESTWWERIIDRPWRFGKKKANFKAGGEYAGTWWALPSLNFKAPAALAAETAISNALQKAMQDAGTATPAQAVERTPPPDELWLVEGIFDAIALAHHGIAAVALLSCNNYPEKALARLKAEIEGQDGAVDMPTLVWALDSDKAGQEYTLKWVKRAREAGWECEAAQIPQRGKGKTDWNDLHQLDRLAEGHLKEYRYRGALLLAESAADKALLMYHHTGGADFYFEFNNRLFWWKLNLERFGKAEDAIRKAIAEGTAQPMSDEALRDKALRESGGLQPIANCNPKALYYQRNDLTAEAWYYFGIWFPDSRPPVKGPLTAGQLTTASEFKKQLLHMAAGANFSGNSHQLEVMMQRQLEAIKTVQTVDYIGYSSAHKAYVLGKVAVREGVIAETNAEDYFEFGKLALKSLQRSVNLQINTDREAYTRDWQRHLWTAFGPKGFIALAFWFGSLFAEQVRADQQSFPFLEIVGEPGSGKSTLLQFLWKLLGRDYEGFDPSKSTSAGRMRTFTQVSNLPIVLIESDRETKTGNQAHVRSFDWDELKDAYNGNSIRTTGVKTGGNETYDPPFRASIVISQNNQVQASQAVMERICHMTFDTKGFTPASYESAKALERVDAAHVSGFILAALTREAEVMRVLTDSHDDHVRYLLGLDGIHKPRIAKNHAQLLAMATAVRGLVRISDEQFDQVREEIVTMARERQASINADHPTVNEFWEAFDYLDSLGRETLGGKRIETPLLNHSVDPELIAVNLNEYVEQAAVHRQQIPVLGDLKKVLRTSKARRFIDIKTVRSAIRTRATSDGSDEPKTVYCWVFARSGRRS